jgi:hypothetical protein
MRNDLTIYDKAAERWWSDDLRWVRTLKNHGADPPTPDAGDQHSP